jgi:hypothetical protein
MRALPLPNTTTGKILNDGTTNGTRGDKAAGTKEVVTGVGKAREVTRILGVITAGNGMTSDKAAEIDTTKV